MTSERDTFSENSYNTSATKEAPNDDESSSSSSSSNILASADTPETFNYGRNATVISTFPPPTHTDFHRASENHEQQVNVGSDEFPSSSNEITYLPTTVIPPTTTTTTTLPSSSSSSPTTVQHHHRQETDKSREENMRQKSAHKRLSNDAIIIDNNDSITFEDDSTTFPNAAELSENFNSLLSDDMMTTDRVVVQHIGTEVFRFDEFDNNGTGDAVNNNSQSAVNDSIYFKDDLKEEMIEMSTRRHIEGLPSEAEDGMLGYEGSGVGGENDKINPQVIKTLTG